MVKTVFKEVIEFPDKPLIAISGTVGVGKTTLAKRLSKRLKMTYILENDNNPYMEKFYTNMNTWGFNFQIYYLIERLKEQIKIYQSNGGFVLDRTIYEDAEIFATMLHDRGYINSIDYQTYISLFESIINNPLFKKPDLIVFLDGDLNDIINRIIKRSRNVELNTPREYWEELSGKYENWILNYNHCPIIRIDTSKVDLLSSKELDKLILKIIEELNMTSQ